MRGSRFALKMETIIFVFFFSGTEVISRFPSADFTGHASRRTVSSFVLKVVDVRVEYAPIACMKQLTSLSRSIPADTFATSP